MSAIWPRKTADDHGPDEAFAGEQAALARFPEPELQLHGADFQQVAVPQEGVLGRLAVDGDERIGPRREQKTLGGIEAELEMFVPNAVFLQLQVGCGGTSDRTGKRRATQRRPPFSRKEF